MDAKESTSNRIGAQRQPDSFVPGRERTIVESSAIDDRLQTTVTHIDTGGRESITVSGVYPALKLELASEFESQDRALLFCKRARQ